MNKIKKCIKFILSNILLITYLAIIIYMSISTRYTIGYSKHTILQYILIGVLAFIIIDIYIAKKQNLVFTKTDCLMFLLVISSTIPLIAGNAASLESTIMATIKYIAIIQMYFITKYIISKNPASKKVIINVFIIIAIVLALVGIEKMTSNKLNLLSFDKTRLESLFNSGNTLAAVIGVAIFLSLGQLADSQKRSAKIFQIANTSILAITFILTYSRLMYMSFALTLFFYFFVNRKTNFGKQSFLLILTSILIGIVYAMFFTKKTLAGGSYKIWAGLAIAVAIDIVINYLISSKLEGLTTLKGKKSIIVILIILMMIGVIYIVFLGNISQPLALFNSKTANGRYEKVIKNITGNTSYIIELDVEAVSNSEGNFKIIVEERNKYQDYENEKSIKLGNYIGKETIEFTTQPNTSELHIIFSADNTDENTRLIIKDIRINGKKEILSYKYLPTKLVEKIENINFQNKSAWERISFYVDAGRLIKENWLSGIGGDCWKYRYTEHQDYNFISTEVHSYPIQVFLEFGIFGVLAYIGIIVFVIRKSVKNEKKGLGVAWALVCIILHSFFDYDMSFMYVATMLFSLIAIIDDEDGKKISVKNSKLINSILIILTAIIILNNIIYFLYLVNEKKINQLDRESQERVYNDFIVLMPYNRNIRVKCSKYSEGCFVQYKYLLDNETYYLSEDDSFFIYTMYEFVQNAVQSNEIENLEALLNYFERTKLTKKFYPRYQINRLITILALGEYINEFENSSNYGELKKLEENAYTIVINEIEQKKKSILDYDNGRYPARNVEFYEEELQSIYEEAINHLE